MKKIEVLLPQWGMGMSEGTVVSWHKKVGERVEEDEALADIESAKVEDTVESPATGTLTEILVEVGETVDVRSVIAVIEAE